MSKHFMEARVWGEREAYSIERDEREIENLD